MIECKIVNYISSKLLWTNFVQGSHEDSNGHFNFESCSLNASLPSCVSLVLIVAMARPIKLFQFLQKLYHLIGIHPPQSNENHKFNLQNGFFIFAWVQMVTLTGAFILFKAKTFSEFSISFHICVTTLVNLFGYIMNIYQKGNILNLIEKLNEFIGKS